MEVKLWQDFQPNNNWCKMTKKNDKKCCENYDKIFNLRMLPEMEKMVSGGVRRHSNNRFNIQPTSLYPTCCHMIILFPKSLILQGGTPRISQHQPFNQIPHFHPNMASILSSLSLFFLISFQFLNKIGERGWCQPPLPHILSDHDRLWFVRSGFHIAT